MTATEAPALVDAYRSTWVELNAYGRVSKIETFPRFSATWRGRPVVVTMACDRYLAGMDRDSLSLTEWRAYAREAREAADDGRGAELTELARSRLGAELRPIVLAWLDSPGFRAEYVRAIVSACLREIADARPAVDSEGSRFARAVEANANALGSLELRRLAKVRARWAEFADAYNAAGE